MGGKSSVSPREASGHGLEPSSPGAMSSPHDRPGFGAVALPQLFGEFLPIRTLRKQVETDPTVLDRNTRRRLEAHIKDLPRERIERTSFE
jgi:hypothetical protein